MPRVEAFSFTCSAAKRTEVKAMNPLKTTFLLTGPALLLVPITATGRINYVQ